MSDEFDDLYGSRFLAAADLKSPVIATIERVETETFSKPGESSKRRGVIYVRGGKKGIVINKTNANNLANAFGKSLPAWVGQRIIIKAETATFGGKVVPALRLYPAPNGGAAIAAPPKQPEPPPAPPPSAYDVDDEIRF